MNDDGSFVAAWVADRFGLVVRTFDPAGNPHGPEVRVDTDVPGSFGGGGVPYVDVAAEGAGGFVIVWKQTLDDGNGALFARRYGADDQPVGSPFHVDDPAAAAPTGMDAQVAVNDRGEVFVAWRRRPFNSTSGAGDVLGRVFSETNLPEGDQFLIDGGGDHSLPSVGAAKNGFVVTWRDSSGVSGGPQSIRAQRFNRHGHAQGGPVLIESDLPPGGGGVFYGGPWVDAATDGRFAVAWSRPAAQSSQPGTTYLRQFNADGVAVSGPVQLGTGPDSLGLNGFATDDNLAHGLLVWGNTDFSIGGQFVSDPTAAPSSALTGAGDTSDAAATDLLYA
jgi:hypothetical protein